MENHRADVAHTTDQIETVARSGLTGVMNPELSAREAGVMPLHHVCPMMIAENKEGAHFQLLILHLCNMRKIYQRFHAIQGACLQKWPELRWI